MAYILLRGQTGATPLRLKGETSIGRSSSNDVVISDPRVSSFHSHISEKDGEWYYEDLGSTNGSYINGEPQTAVVLAEGDVIRIGHAELVFGHAAGARQTVVAGLEAPRQSSRAVDLGRIVREDKGVSQVSRISSFAATLVPEAAGVEDAATLARRLKVCYEISKATAATLDLSKILDRVLTVLFDVFEAADHGFVFLADPMTGLARAAATKTRSGDTAEISISRTALDGAMSRREAVLCMDATREGDYATAQSIVSLGIRSLMIAPLVFHDDVLGAIHVDTRGAAGKFTDADLKLLSAAAAQVAACVANGLLHEQVVASERLAAVGQTVAGLAHCIKNILQGIKGGGYIVDKGFAEDNIDRIRSGWDMVRRNNTFMEDLVFDLLSYSKERMPDYETVDLGAVCEDVCAFVSGRAQGKGVLVSLEKDESLGPVKIDPKGIRRALLNLLTNAIDACNQGKGRVAIATGCSADQREAHVRIGDNGCGMSEETKAQLFTVFFSTKGAKGTGLGLPVTRKIIEEHGGAIDVESEEGKGTTFTVRLPREKPADKQEGAQVA